MLRWIKEMLKAMVFVLFMALLGALIIFALDWLVHHVPKELSISLSVGTYLILYKLYGGKNNG